VNTICDLEWPLLKTPHDGEHRDASIEVYDPGHPHRLVVSSKTTGDLAYLDAKDHRLWALNPGLREALKRLVSAMTLVL
jgi:hypothetical protein